MSTPDNYTHWCRWIDDRVMDAPWWVAVGMWALVGVIAYWQL